MPNTLERLVYVSEGAAGSLTLTGISQILGEAQRNNERRGITGALAIGDVGFLQVVEGPRDVLDALLERLRRDPRHHDLRVLDRSPVTERAFEGWAMKGPLSSASVRDLVARAARGDEMVAEVVRSLNGLS